ncbi:hypothetical protein SAMN04489760_14618 [Syntrophus gentianae]|uniref:Outer membrane protein assembly factor BamE, lipoprotein component of the BamABCDE complex n=1 Tax=Syntrophus gentianae TaxID=43775 RepID=A0A1H8B4M7_9BACT|nr:hypothetical protein [Syntrophus gentianae]SEM77832.1 hypothetical protein SAMN04489760_14618 [Syntrophus gentianae]
MNKMVMRLILMVMAGGILFQAAGCAVIGRDKNYRPFDTQGLSRIVPGKTTAEETVRLFGAPTEVVKLSNGNAYLYSRSVAKATGLWLVLVTFANYDRQYDQLAFFFDADNILTHYGSSLHSDEASYGMPF